MNNSARWRGFTRQIEPPPRLSFAKWAPRHVRIIDGKTPYYDPAATPWVIEPMAALTDRSVKELCFCWPTGSGKSALFEAWLCWILACEPFSIQCSHQNEEASRRWVEKRVRPTLEACDLLRPILDATPAQKKRKLELIFPSGLTYYFGGANKGRLQDVSVSGVLAQETWAFTPGMIAEAKART